MRSRHIFSHLYTPIPFLSRSYLKLFMKRYRITDLMISFYYNFLYYGSILKIESAIQLRILLAFQQYNFYFCTLTNKKVRIFTVHPHGALSTAVPQGAN